MVSAAGGAGLINDRLSACGPIPEFVVHRTRSRNMLTCDDSTPPSPCSSAIEASRTWRLPADYISSLQQWLPRRPLGAGYRKLGDIAWT